MQLIPEWMTNIHPLIVHFPIALLIFAVAADFAGLILKRYDWIKPATLWLYVFGALGTIGAYISGKQAADVVNFPPLSYPVISEHADLALYTMIFFGVYAIVRLLTYWKQWDQRTSVAIILFLIAGGGLGLIQETAEHGGELVFRFGVGTVAQQTSAPPKIETPATATIAIAENGSWNWKAGKNGALSLRQNFSLKTGSWENITLRNIQPKDETAALNIRLKDNAVFVFAFGPDLKNLQIRLRVNLDRFKGRFFVAHHINSPATYDFLAVEGHDVRLGRTKAGSLSFFDTGVINEKEWLTLKAVSSSGHYRGYINDKLITHGHGSDLQAGTAGFVIAGSGSVQISEIDVVSLDNAPAMNMDMNSMPHEDSEGTAHQH